MSDANGSSSGNAKLVIGLIAGGAIAAVVMIAMRPEPPPVVPAAVQPPIVAAVDDGADTAAVPAEPTGQPDPVVEAVAALPEAVSSGMPQAPEVGDVPAGPRGPAWVPKTEKEARELLDKAIKTSGGMEAITAVGADVWSLRLSRYDMPQVWKLRVAGDVVEAKSPREGWRVASEGKSCVRTFNDVGGECGADENLRLRHVATARDAILLAPLLRAPWDYVSVEPNGELLSYRFKRADRAGALQLDVYIDPATLHVVGFSAHDQKRGFSGLVGTRARMGSAWLPTQWRMRVIENAEVDPDAEKVPGPVGGDGKVLVAVDERAPREPDMPHGTKIDRYEFVVSLVGVETDKGDAPTLGTAKKESAVVASERGEQRVLRGAPGAAAKALAAMKPLFANPAVDLASVRVYFERDGASFSVLASIGPDAQATGAVRFGGGAVARKTVLVAVSDLSRALDKLAAEASAAGMTPATDRPAAARMLTMPVDWESGESNATAIFQLELPIAGK